MVPARCKCSGLAARCCLECGNGLNAAGQCYTHPTRDTATVRCVECGHALCFWHFVLGPVLALVGGVSKVTVRPRCFPSCEHKFSTPETQPTPIPIVKPDTRFTP